MLFSFLSSVSLVHKLTILDHLMNKISSSLEMIMFFFHHLPWSFWISNWLFFDFISPSSYLNFDSSNCLNQQSKRVFWIYSSISLQPNLFDGIVWSTVCFPINQFNCKSSSTKSHFNCYASQSSVLRGEKEKKDNFFITLAAIFDGTVPLST